jgi:inorganic pyrophosphatase
MLRMADDGGPDAKILAVPIDPLTDLYRGVSSFGDLPESLLAQIAHFFEHYKDLEAGKWVKVGGWLGPEEAKAELLACVARYLAEPEKPQF